MDHATAGEIPNAQGSSSVPSPAGACKRHDGRTDRGTPVDTPLWRPVGNTGRERHTEHASRGRFRLAWFFIWLNRQAPVEERQRGRLSEQVARQHERQRWHERKKECIRREIGGRRTKKPRRQLAEQTQYVAYSLRQKSRPAPPYACACRKPICTNFNAELRCPRFGCPQPAARHSDVEHDICLAQPLDPDARHRAYIAPLGPASPFSTTKRRAGASRRCSGTSCVRL